MAILFAVTGNTTLLQDNPAFARSLLTRTHYVKYTQGYLSCTIVDFDRGEITVETLDDPPTTV